MARGQSYKKRKNVKITIRTRCWCEGEVEEMMPTSLRLQLKNVIYNPHGISDSSNIKSSLTGTQKGVNQSCLTISRVKEHKHQVFYLPPYSSWLSAFIAHLCVEKCLQVWMSSHFEPFWRLLRDLSDRYYEYSGKWPEGNSSTGERIHQSASEGLYPPKLRIILNENHSENHWEISSKFTIDVDRMVPCAPVCCTNGSSMVIFHSLD